MTDAAWVAARRATVLALGARYSDRGTRMGAVALHTMRVMRWRLWAIVALAALCGALTWRVVALEHRVEAAWRMAVEVSHDAAALRELAIYRTEEVDVLLSALGAGEPVRCSWSMVPSDGKSWLKDAVALKCSRLEPCVATWEGALVLPD